MSTPTEATSKSTAQERRVERAIRELDRYSFSDSSEVYGQEACSVYTPSGNRYTVFSDFCSCKDHENRGHLGIICKHRIAAMLAGYVKPTSVDVNDCTDGDDYAAKIRAEGAERLAARKSYQQFGWTVYQPARPTDEAELARVEGATPSRPSDEAEWREWMQMQEDAARADLIEAVQQDERTSHWAEPVA